MQTSKRMIKKLTFLFIIVFVFLSSEVWPCTTFCLRTQDRVVFGRNYDWDIGDGLVVINKRNVEKNLLSSFPKANSKWVSRYGSISFNQYGVDAPMDGLNEAGLVVAQMWLDGTRYPKADSRSRVGALSWIQYHLDNSANVQDVIESDKKIRIDPEISAPLHFLVCDISGQVAVIEFLDEKMVVHTGKNLTYAALANSTYSASLRYLKDKKSKSTSRDRSWTANSMNRFAKAAEMVATYEPQKSDIVDYGFEVLQAVNSPGRTQWSIVYDITNFRVSFKTKQQPTRKTVHLKEFQLNCQSPMEIIDINSTNSGDISKFFTTYTTQTNKDLIYKTYKNTPFLQYTADYFLNDKAKYPESFRCMQN